MLVCMGTVKVVTGDDLSVQDTAVADALRDGGEAGRAAQSIARLRQSIDAVDEMIVRLLAQRFALTRQVGQCKAKAGFAALDSERERRQVARLTGLAEECGLDREIVRRYHAMVVDASKSRHRAIAARRDDIVT